MNLYVHGSLAEVEADLRQAGWTQAAPDNAVDNARYIGSVIGQGLYLGANLLWRGAHALWSWVTRTPDQAGNLPDPFAKEIASMPVSTQTYRGQAEVVAFEMNNDPDGGRHHLRIFDTGEVDAQGRHVWAIAATQDTGIKVDPNRPEQGFLNHAVNPNADAERDLVLRSLRSSGDVASVATLTPSGARPQGGTAADADGRVYDVVLSGTSD